MTQLCRISPNAPLLLFFLVFLGLSNSGTAQTFTKNGTVFEDYNASGTVNTGEPETNAGGTLCAYLINNITHEVLFSEAVSISGSYSFTVPALSGGASYIVAIAKCGMTVGTVFTGGSSTYNNYLVFPSGWSNVAPGGNRWKAAGNGTNSVNDFFIRKIPTAGNVQSQYFSCNPSGCIAIPGLAGTAATGSAMYNIEEYKIITVPTGGTLKSGSTTITAGQILSPSEAANLCFIKTTGEGKVTFQYVATDIAGGVDYFSDTAIYSIRLGGVNFRRDVPSSVLLACNSQAITLYTSFISDTTGYTFTYSWTGPASFSSTSKNPVLVANSAVEDALYIITASDQNGCQSKDTLKAKRMDCFPFCDGGNAYLIKGSGSTNDENLYRYNINTGVTTTVSSSLTSVDAVCYNIYNNLIYGWAEGSSPLKHIYAIDAAGKQVDLGLSQDAALFDDKYFAGTAGGDGRWYMARGMNDVILKVIDIDPKSPTYMRQVDEITASGGTIDPWDITWNASDSMIYGVSGTELYRINPRTGVINKFPANVPGGSGSYGAQYIDNNFNHFISDNVGGDIYKTSLAGGAGGTINFTQVSGGPTGFYNDATVNPVQPTDFGDAPSSYGQAYHKFNCSGGAGSEHLYLGTRVDYEATSLHSPDARGDDNDASNDEDGVSFMPFFFPCNDSSTFFVTVTTHNGTGSDATLSGWLDLNNNGLFDANERQQETIANGQTFGALAWTGFSSSFLPGSYIYARFRIASTAGEVDNPTGQASIGEVEDYRIPVLGRDEGDAPSAVYDTPVSFVYPDENNDKVPDHWDALWLGTYAAASDGSTPCNNISNPDANGDDNEGIDDEDGFIPNGGFVPGVPRVITFTANGNTHNHQGFYGLWIDWDNNGFENTANEFYSGGFTVGSPVTVSVTVTPPPGPVPVQIYFRFRVGEESPLPFSDYNSIKVNGETEDYHYLNNSVTPLPVAFINFFAVREGEDVLLKWQTASEYNNSGFEVQHSRDGISWQTISFITASGNSNTLRDYHYIHKNPGKGIHDYRIKQVDINGNTAFTAIRKVNIDADNTIIIQAYPNPAKDRLFISSSSGTTVKEVCLFNTVGQQVFRSNNLPNGGSVNISSVTAGAYILRVQCENGETQYKKIVIE